MNTREQNRNDKRTEIERFGWFVGWLRERTDEKTPYFALTSYCNTIGQSNNAVSMLGFPLAGKRRVHVLIFLSTETIFQGHTKIALFFLTLHSVNLNNFTGMTERHGSKKSPVQQSRVDFLLASNF